MQILIFPALASIIMIVSGLFFVWPGFERLISRRWRRWPVKLIGVFWLLMAVGVWLSSTFALQSFFIHVVAVFMAADAATFILVPTTILVRSLVWSGRKGATYRIFYALFLIIIGGILFGKIYNYWSA